MLRYYLQVNQDFNVIIWEGEIECVSDSIAIITIDNKEWVVRTDRIFDTKEEALKAGLEIVNDEILRLHNVADILAIELMGKHDY